MAKFAEFGISATTDLSDLKYKLGTKWNSGSVKKRLAEAAMEATNKHARQNKAAAEKAGYGDKLMVDVAFANQKGRIVYPRPYSGYVWDVPPAIKSPDNPPPAAIANPHTHSDVTQAVCDCASEILSEWF